MEPYPHVLVTLLFWGVDTFCCIHWIQFQQAAPEVTEQKGDLLIRDLWQQGTDSVHDMHVVNTDSLTYQLKKPEKFLHEA